MNMLPVLPELTPTERAHIKLIYHIKDDGILALTDAKKLLTALSALQPVKRGCACKGCTTIRKIKKYLKR